MKTIKNTISVLLLLAVSLLATAQTARNWKAIEKPLNFILANDLGRNGYYEQKPIAQTMGELADSIDVECVVAAGDIHHFEGVRSTQDPLWLTNYELIYSHPSLMIPWYAVAGNHEYRGNTQACVDYSKVSARWNMPERYYTFTLDADDEITLRIVMLDTTPLIDKYRSDSKYPDAALADRARQLAWTDSVLTAAKEDWVVVVGHHPVYADTPKSNSERADMQKYLNPILLRHKDKVAMYLCGHIHNFQHIRPQNSTIDYVVNSSASLSRQKVKPIDGTVFCNGDAGFSLVTADKKLLALHMMNAKGEVIHTVVREKKQ